MKKILIAIDDGPTAEKVATLALKIGRQLHAEMALISVIDDATTITDGGVTPAEMAAIIKNEFKKRHQMLIDNVFQEYKVWSFIDEGKPFEVILKVAEEWETDLIVLGTHGRTGISHLLMGSVAEKVLRHSKKPLLIVPTS